MPLKPYIILYLYLRAYIPRRTMSRQVVVIITAVVGSGDNKLLLLLFYGDFSVPLISSAAKKVYKQCVCVRVRTDNKIIIIYKIYMIY